MVSQSCLKSLTCFFFFFLSGKKMAKRFRPFAIKNYTLAGDNNGACEML